MNDLFYFLGAALAVLALVVSFFGIRSESFPGSRGALIGGLGVFATLVVVSCAFAVALSADEQQKRSVEIAAYRAQQAQQDASQQAPGAPSQDATEAPAPADTETKPQPVLALMAAPGGSLAFDSTSLDAKAGEVTIDFTNPSPVPHNVAIEAKGETVAQSATVSDGSNAQATAQLEPGKYTYYCSIPGHREGGMEGTLTVK